MVERHGVDTEFLFIKRSAAEPARELLNFQSELKLEIAGSECRIQKRTKAFRTEDVERLFAAIEMEGTDQSGDPIQMVTVKMPDKNAVNMASFNAGAHDLQLGAFTAVKEENVAFANQGGG
jgi:hypothetical protein